MRTLLVLGSLFLVHPVAADPAFTAQAEAVVQGYADSDGFSGSVLVALDGNPIFRQGFGYANREWNIPNTPETKFRIGSLTKSFTAAAILQLAERGRLGLDDPVSRHYAKAPPSWSAIALRHLLSMHSGIPSFSDTPGYWESWSKIQRKPEEGIDLIRDAPLRFPPGAKYEYSNSNYAILGLVIEAASGRSYEAHLRAAILDPLGLRDTGLDNNEAVLPARASGYEREGGVWRNAAYLAMTIPFASGGIYSTVDDLLTWDQALYDESVIGAGSLRAMFADHGDGYGYGWFVGARSGRRIHAHSGGNSGFHGIFCRYPDDRLTVIVLANLGSSPVAQIANELASLHLGTSVHLCHEAY